MRRSSPNPGSLPKCQRGATMIVVVVILAVMTLLGITAVSDNSMQSAMVRNNQLQMLAYNTALSEINAQIYEFNVILDTQKLLDALTDSESLRELDPGEIYEQLRGTQFTQDVNISFLYEGPSWAGNEVGTFRELFYEIESDAVLPGTATRSDQVQGISFIAPN